MGFESNYSLETQHKPHKGLITPYIPYKNGNNTISSSNLYYHDNITKKVNIPEDFRRNRIIPTERIFYSSRKKQSVVETKKNPAEKIEQEKAQKMILNKIKPNIRDVQNKPKFLELFKCNVELKDHDKSITTIKDELSDILYPEKSEKVVNIQCIDECFNVKNYLFYDAKNKTLDFTLETFKENYDFNKILEVGKNLVEIEILSYSKFDAVGIAETIKPIKYSEIISEVKKSQLNIICVELNYIYEKCGNFTETSIKKGHVIYMHYIWVVIKYLTDLLFDEKLCRNELHYINTLNIITFFIRKLLSELLIGFNFDPQKVETYRILNTISYYSANAPDYKKYFSYNLFTIMMRASFRFLFDSVCKIDYNWNTDLIIQLITNLQRHLRPPNNKRGIYEFFHKNFL
ncbi:hypothetical protein CWI36_0064p0020 [Hamiltosporidium magnivora]|uniref:Uncharacterized protein n=1 Tax=Hamiltosporidium magnivora TaxID=148818 RepID=A0A4Q9LP36_9MICR|nr:hypothetical protein CWI36_0064p0020 [Hamiltosporidium magnivora]